MKLTKWQTYIPIVVLIVLIVLPKFMNPRYVDLFFKLFLNIILALGVFSVWTVGFINAAQPAFYGLGAYTVAMLTIKAGLPFWLAFPLAGVIPALVAALFGSVGLKLKGAYFLFLTIALNEFISWAYKAWPKVTGGTMGLYPVPQPHIQIFGFGVDFGGSLTPYYYAALILAVVTCLVYFRLHNSRLGRVWESVGKTENLMANTGISVFAQKQIAFVASCFFAGLAGALYAPYMMIVTPSQFTLYSGIWLVLGALVGGIFSPLGAIIGTVFMAILNYAFTYLPQGTLQFQPLVLGLILVLVLLFMPTGILGLSERIRNRVKGMSGNKSTQTEGK
jgi:branched-chain amino acid transport system permease protein